MSTLLALLLVGAGSLAFRLAPLLGADRMPEQASRVASWAGLSVLAAVTVRGVLHHRDDSVPAPVLLAAVAVGAGLWVASRGRPALVALATGAGTYLVLAAATTGLPALVATVTH